MNNVLVFGVQGMLGSALVRQLRSMGVAVRGAALSWDGEDDLIHGIDISDPSDIDRAMDTARPEVVVNCAGIVKSECSSLNVFRAQSVNSDGPHAIADAARRYGCRFIHVSTDCVFSGRKGSYLETDPTDAEDLYGQTKAAGEIVDRSDCLTLRTSFIGRDPRRHRGLLEWLLTQNARGALVQGWECALWSGLSAPELARAIHVALNTPTLSGLYHVAGPVISKADLLETLVRELSLKCRVERVDGEVIDRTLDGTRFAEATGYAAPSWTQMAKELV